MKQIISLSPVNLLMFGTSNNLCFIFVVASYLFHGICIHNLTIQSSEICASYHRVDVVLGLFFHVVPQMRVEN